MNCNKIMDNSPKHYGFLMLDCAMPQFITDIQAQIPEEDLYVDPEGKEEYGLEKQSHVTIYPCMKSTMEEFDKIRSILPMIKNLKLSLKDVSTFENPDSDYIVLKADVESEQLHELNSKIAEVIPSDTEFKEYHPHMTIAYLKKDSKIPEQFCKLFDELIEATPICYDYSYYDDDINNHIELYV